MIDRETLGRIVRLAWVEWAREQPSPKPSWLKPWEELSETGREADRRIGEFTANFVLSEHNPLSEYQEEVQRTTGTKTYGETLVMAVMGLAGETGEVCDILKKHVFHDHELDRGKIVKECGDVLWYLTCLCNTLDVPLSEVIEVNVDKLRRRYPSGFDTERSRNREETNNGE